MRLHRFYMPGPLASRQFVSIGQEDLLHQWRNVFRYGAGDRVILFDGCGTDYYCQISRLDKTGADLTVMESASGVVPEREVWLFVSLIKKDKLEWVAEKATELGVSHIVPMLTERSEKKNFNSARLKKIMIEASEQCGRSDIPAVHETLELAQATAFCRENKIAMVGFDMSGAAYPEKKSRTPLALFIGPEGGFSESEVFMLREAGAVIASLGNLTLRAETAVVSALARLLCV